MKTVTEELEQLIRQSGDTLNRVSAALQAAYAWIIAQGTCPDCYGDLDIDDDISDPVNWICVDCSRSWLYNGKERIDL